MLGQRPAQLPEGPAFHHRQGILDDPASHDLVEQAARREARRESVLAGLEPGRQPIQPGVDLQIQRRPQQPRLSLHLPAQADHAMRVSIPASGRRREPQGRIEKRAVIGIHEVQSWAED